MKKVVPVVSYCSCCLINSLFFFLVVEFLDGLLEFILDLVHPLLETLDTLAQATHELGNLPAAEEEQDDSHNENNLACTKVKKRKYSV